MPSLTNAHMDTGQMIKTSVANPGHAVLYHFQVHIKALGQHKSDKVSVNNPGIRLFRLRSTYFITKSILSYKSTSELKGW